MSHFTKIQFFLADEVATEKAAQAFAVFCRQWFSAGHSRLMISLAGNLGAGKSFFARSFIQSFLPEQKVKSPTYTLVESYALDFAKVQHFDLYRLCDPEELEYLGIRDLLEPPVIGLIEWAEKGEGFLPEFDLTIALSPKTNEGINGRQISFSASNLELMGGVQSMMLGF